MAPLPPRQGRGGIGSSSSGPSNHDLPPHMAARSDHQNSGWSNGDSQGQGQGHGYGHGGRQQQQEQASGSSSSAEVATTLFVGGISLGVSDDELSAVLKACGSLSNLNRVSPAFGFATFSEPDSVLRALAVLNRKELPAHDPKGKDPNPKPKKLNVKADEKTRKFLDQYEQTLIKTDVSVAAAGR